MARETLSRYFPQGGLGELGFRSSQPGGYALEGPKLYAFYTGEVVTGHTNEGPLVRRMLLLTDGENWLVGARNGKAKTSDMLDDLLHVVKMRNADPFLFPGDILPGVLSVPHRLPEIPNQPKPEKYSSHLDGVSGHSFE